MIVARTPGGQTLLVERCELGAGNVALSPLLFPDGRAPLAELVSNGTSYRAHACQLSDLLEFLRVRRKDRWRAPAFKRTL